MLAVMKLIDAALRCELPRGRYAYIAPQLKQGKAVAWDYIKAYARLVPGTTINESETWIEFPNEARIRIYGADDPDSLRGLYLDGAVLDEVAQMKSEAWDQVISPALADRQGWVLFIGTPKGINLFSQLYFKAMGDPEWYAGCYTCEQTGAVPKDELELARRTMTPSSYAQEYLCDFEASSDNNLISIHDVLEAQKRGLLHQDRYDFAPKVMAVDVAHQGGDCNVIFGRQGLQAFTPKVYTGLPEKTFAGEIATSIERFKPVRVFVDTTGGYGHEVISRLYDRGYSPEPVVFSWKAGSERFQNCRAEMWFKMAAWLKSGGALACGAHMTQLQAELCAPTYSNDNAAGRLQLESKDDIRERLGRSPDMADALAMTFFSDVATREQAARQAHAATEYDPLARVM